MLFNLLAQLAITLAGIFAVGAMLFFGVGFLFGLLTEYPFATTFVVVGVIAVALNSG